MVIWWFGLVVWIPRISFLKGIGVLRGIPTQTSGPQTTGPQTTGPQPLADGRNMWDQFIYQWLILVPVKGGRWHIIHQLAVYTTYIPLIVLAFPDMLPIPPFTGTISTSIESTTIPNGHRYVVKFHQAFYPTSKIECGSHPWWRLRKNVTLHDSEKKNRSS